MKKMFLAAFVAACFNMMSVSAQVTDDDVFIEIDSLDTEDDFIEVDLSESNISTTVTIGDKKPSPLTETEKKRIKKYLNDGYSLVEEDESGAVILKRDKRYICINPRLSNELFIKDAEKIEFTDITGCGMDYGVSAKIAGKVLVYTQKGTVLIPETTGELVEVIVNPFKHKDNTPSAYAIFKEDGKYYAVLSNGNRYELKMDACQLDVMTIFGIKGNGIYCFTPESMEKPEYICNINDDVLYEEGELLTVVGKGRYDYMGIKKYSDVTPAVLVKRGNDYFVYPGGQKVVVRKKTDIEVKVSKTKVAIFSGYFSPIRALVECIKENNSE